MQANRGSAVPEPVLRERRRLGQAGVVCVSLRLRAGEAAERSGAAAAGEVRVQTVGVVADPELLEQLEPLVAAGSQLSGEHLGGITRAWCIRHPLHEGV